MSRRLGYAVMEGPDKLVACGNKAILRDKNAKALAWVNRFIKFYQPDVLVLPNVTAEDTRRAARIKTLHRQIVAWERKRQLKVRLVSVSQVRTLLLGATKGTKFAVAQTLVGKFPTELETRLPAKRRPRLFETAGVMHNDWLETLITFGRLGATPIFLTLLLVLAHWFGGGGIHGNKYFVMLLLVALGGCLIHACFDFPFQIHSVLALFLVLCAVLSCLARRVSGS